MPPRNIVTPIQLSNGQQIFLPHQISDETRAKHYITTRWQEQYDYYLNKTETQRKRYLRLQVMIGIVAVIVPVLIGMTGALTTWVTEFATQGGVISLQTSRTLNLFINALPAVLSGFVAIGTAIENVYHYGVNWRAYKNALEGLRRERVLFEAKAGSYLRSSNPYRLFIERCEDVISEETGGFFERAVITDDGNEEEEAQGEETVDGEENLTQSRSNEALVGA
ncbi:MAG: DUF4231 domain-containing protein [Phototrophicaceae bacterium]